MQLRLKYFQKTRQRLSTIDSSYSSRITFVSKKCHAYESNRENLISQRWEKVEVERIRISRAIHIYFSYDHLKQMSSSFFFSSNDSLATLCCFHLHLNLLELYVSFVRFLSAHVVQSDSVDRIYHEFRKLHVSFVRFLSVDNVQNDFVDKILIMNFESCTNHSYLTVIVFIEDINIIIVRAERS